MLILGQYNLPIQISCLAFTTDVGTYFVFPFSYLPRYTHIQRYIISEPFFLHPKCNLRICVPFCLFSISSLSQVQIREHTHTHISILMYPFLTPPHQQERISSCLHMYTFSMFLFLRHSPYPKLPDCHNNSSPSQSSLSLPLSFFSLSLHSDDVTLLFV